VAHFVLSMKRHVIGRPTMHFSVFQILFSSRMCLVDLPLPTSISWKQSSGMLVGIQICTQKMLLALQWHVAPITWYGSSFKFFNHLLVQNLNGHSSSLTTNQHEKITFVALTPINCIQYIQWRIWSVWLFNFCTWILLDWKTKHCLFHLYLCFVVFIYLCL